MENIKPVSDLENYNEILKDVDVGSPVYLTVGGKGRYILADIRDYEKQRAAIELLAALAEGEKSVRDGNWVSNADIREKYGL